MYYRNILVLIKRKKKMKLQRIICILLYINRRLKQKESISKLDEELKNVIIINIRNI